MGLYQKVRPPKYTDMVGQDIVTRNLLAQSKSGAWFQVLIFGGMYGCGKTTAARITAMAVNCQNKLPNGDPCCECASCKAVLSGNCADVIEVDGASNTGVENVRQLQEQALYLPMVLKKKVFIIDEVHMLSNSAFNSLLKMLEEPPEHCQFILCTTDVEKIPLTIRSRSACYTFGRIAESTLSEYLKQMASKQGYECSDDACRLIARRSDGSMRNALMLLEMVSKASEKMDAENVAEVLGISDEMSVVALLKDILENNIQSLIERIGLFSDDGRNFSVLSGEMLSCVTDMIVFLFGGAITASSSYIKSLSFVSEYGLEKVCEMSKAIERMKIAMRSDSSKNAFIVSCLDVVDSVNVKETVMVKVAADDVSAETVSKVSVSDVNNISGNEEEKTEIKTNNVTSDETKAVEAPVAETKAEEDEEDEEDDAFDIFGEFFGFSSGDNDEEEDEDGFKSIGKRDNPFEDLISKPVAAPKDVESKPEPTPVETDTETVSNEAEDEPNEDSEPSEPIDEELQAYYAQKDEEDKGFPFPSFLKDTSGLSANAKEAVYKLREVCKLEKSINSNLTNGFRMETDENGIKLVCKELLALQSVMIVMSRYEIPNIQYVPG